MFTTYSLHRLLGLPKQISASEMFRRINLPLFHEELRKFAFSFTRRISNTYKVICREKINLLWDFPKLTVL